jgi:hypothetical protein
VISRVFHQHGKVVKMREKNYWVTKREEVGRKKIQLVLMD